MEGAARAKSRIKRIKRVDRFLGNKRIERARAKPCFAASRNRE